MKVKPSDVRAAREFLRKRGVRGLSPRQFAAASQEAGVSYQTLLAKLAGVAERKIKGGTSTVRAGAEQALATGD